MSPCQALDPLSAPAHALSPQRHEAVLANYIPTYWHYAAEHAEEDAPQVCHMHRIPDRVSWPSQHRLIQGTLAARARSSYTAKPMAAAVHWWHAEQPLQWVES